MSKRHGAKLFVFADPHAAEEEPDVDREAIRPVCSPEARCRAEQLLGHVLSPGHQKHRDHFVYLIANTSGTAVKIGRAHDVLARLIELQVGNHEELFVLATFNGNEISERVVQAHFHASRIRGEWYRPTGDIVEFARLLNEAQKADS